MKDKEYSLAYCSGVKLANTTLEECNDENYREVIKNAMYRLYKSVYKCTFKTDGYSCNFNALYDGFVDTMKPKYKDVPYRIYERGLGFDEECYKNLTILK